MRVVSVERVPGERVAYDMEVKDTHAYFVGSGALAHNCALYYENGSLARGVTRGKKDPQTGRMVGVDITENVKLMKGLVKVIPGFTGFIRAEIVLLKSDWKAHFPTMVNPRNGAVGIAKREDSARSDNQHLTVIAYEIRRDGGRKIASKRVEFRLLERLGFRTPAWECFIDLPDALAWHKEYQDTKRATLDYDIDGLIYEEDDRDFFDSLGTSGRGPVGSTAFKFTADAANTILEGIENQVGPTGIVTPVAVFKEVVLSGASVKRASLANWGIIGDLLHKSGKPAFAIGDTIFVSRRGDVIPKVEKWVKATTDAAPIFQSQPTDCPSCSGKLTMVGAFLKCLGDNCPAQGAGAIDRWTSKLDIKGWGDGIIVPLYEAGLIREPADLYVLNLSKATQIRDGNGTRLGRKVQIAHDNLMKLTDLPLHLLIGSLGIPMMARSMCQKIVQAGYDTLPKMEMATEAEIASIPGVGTRKAREFVNGLRDREEIINHLLLAGITIKAPVTGPLKGKSFCFTGFRDSNLERAIEGLGGVMKSGVSRSLTYLVASDPTADSGKAKKARKYGVQVIGITAAEQMAGV